MKPTATLGLLILLAAPASRLPAQEFTPFDKIGNQAQIDRTITALDAAGFDAYNRCDLPRFASFFTEDVEFYHDQTGLTVGRDKLVDSIRANICGKTTRELVPGTLHAFQLNHFGVMETATHRFHHPGHESEGAGEGETVMLWQYKDNAWKISRVISYDHHPIGRK